MTSNHTLQRFLKRISLTRGPKPSAAKRRHMQFESLENRQLMASGVVGGAADPWFVNPATGEGTYYMSSGGDLVVADNGNRLTITQNGVVKVDRLPLSNITSLTIKGSHAQDDITFDLYGFLGQHGVGVTVEGFSWVNGVSDLSWTTPIQDVLRVKTQNGQDSVTLEAGRIVVTSMNGLAIDFSDFEKLIVDTQSNRDEVTVQSTSGVPFIDVLAGAGDDTISVIATDSNSTLRLFGGDGSDTMNVGAGSLHTIQGNVQAYGDAGLAGIFGGTDVLNIRDQAQGWVFGTGQTYSITPTRVDRSGTARISYNQLENLVIDAGRGEDTFIFEGGTNFVPTTIHGGWGLNTLEMRRGYNTWNVTGFSSGHIDVGGRPGGRIDFHSVGRLVGNNNGSDRFVMMSGGSVSQIDGRGGSTGDTLDYSDYTASVNVDLLRGRATGGPWGLPVVVQNIEHVTGGTGNDFIRGNGLRNRLEGGGGNDIVVGLGGQDELLGGSGRDLLIGGDGPDRLHGNDGDDLLIAGRTDYDRTDSALLSILAEWTSGRSYNARVQNIRNGVGANSSVSLSSSTVHGDQDHDDLYGNGGQDWYWVDVAIRLATANDDQSDTVRDRESGEQSNSVLDNQIVLPGSFRTFSFG